MYWVPHDELVWTLANPIDGQLDYSAAEVGRFSIKKEDASRVTRCVDLSIADNVDDLCLLNDASESSLIYLVRSRYSVDRIYTNVGSILIAVNPFQRFPIYGVDYMSDYVMDTVKYPHVYGIARNTVNNFLNLRTNQTILVSGESGAGKTEHTKLILGYFANTCPPLENSQAGDVTIADQIQLCNPILESFGNAKTVRNNNSSRFGKWINLCLSSQSKSIKSKSECKTHPLSLTSAGLTEFLLETTRVISIASQERSFHIFYQIISAINSNHPAVQSIISLLPPNLGRKCATSDFILTGKGCITAGEINDLEEFETLLIAFEALQMEKGTVEEILKCSTACLLLSNLQFDESSDLNGAPTTSIVNEDVLKSVAALLGLDRIDSLRNCLTSKQLKIGRETSLVTVGKKIAVGLGNELSRMIYGRVFSLVVKTIRETLQRGCTARDTNGVGILDLAGFESFDVNGLEQLCINLSNEVLQRQFNKTVFEEESRIYIAEGLRNIESIKFQDNNCVINALESVCFALLDDETKIPQGNDGNYTSKVIKAGASTVNTLSSHGGVIVYGNPGGRTKFTVKHFAGDVIYSTADWVENNRSVTPTLIIEALAASSLGFLTRALANDVEMLNTKDFTSKKKSSDTVTSSFRSSLNSLMAEVQSSECHFIRCIKPNDKSLPRVFESTKVIEQLLFSGVLEAVKVRQVGYPLRILNHRYLHTYSPITSASGIRVDRPEDFTKAFLELYGDYINIGEGIEPILHGKTLTFLKPQVGIILESLRDDAITLCAVKIQTYYRMHVKRKIFTKYYLATQSLSGVLKVYFNMAGVENIDQFENLMPLSWNVHPNELEKMIQCVGDMVLAVLQVKGDKIKNKIKLHNQTDNFSLGSSCDEAQRWMIKAKEYTEISKILESSLDIPPTWKEELDTVKNNIIQMRSIGEDPYNDSLIKAVSLINSRNVKGSLARLVTTRKDLLDEEVSIAGAILESLKTNDIHKIILNSETLSNHLSHSSKILNSWIIYPDTLSNFVFCMHPKSGRALRQVKQLLMGDVVSFNASDGSPVPTPSKLQLAEQNLMVILKKSIIEFNVDTMRKCVRVALQSENEELRDNAAKANALIKVLNNPNGLIRQISIWTSQMAWRLPKASFIVRTENSSLSSKAQGNNDDELKVRRSKRSLGKEADFFSNPMALLRLTSGISIENIRNDFRDSYVVGLNLLSRYETEFNNSCLNGNVNNVASDNTNPKTSKNEESNAKVIKQARLVLKALAKCIEMQLGMPLPSSIPNTNIRKQEDKNNLLLISQGIVEDSTSLLTSTPSTPSSSPGSEIDAQIRSFMSDALNVVRMVLSLCESKTDGFKSNYIENESFATTKKISSKYSPAEILRQGAEMFRKGQMLFEELKSALCGENKVDALTNYTQLIDSLENFFHDELSTRLNAFKRSNNSTIQNNQQRLIKNTNMPSIFIAIERYVNVLLNAWNFLLKSHSNSSNRLTSLSNRPLANDGIQHGSGIRNRKFIFKVYCAKSFIKQVEIEVPYSREVLDSKLKMPVISTDQIVDAVNEQFDIFNGSHWLIDFSPQFRNRMVLFNYSGHPDDSQAYHYSSDHENNNDNSKKQTFNSFTSRPSKILVSEEFEDNYHLRKKTFGIHQIYNTSKNTSGDPENREYDFILLDKCSAADFFAERIYRWRRLSEKEKNPTEYIFRKTKFPIFNEERISSPLAMCFWLLQMSARLVSENPVMCSVNDMINISLRMSLCFIGLCNTNITKNELTDRFFSCSAPFAPYFDTHTSQKVDYHKEANSFIHDLWMQHSDFFPSVIESKRMSFPPDALQTQTTSKTETLTKPRSDTQPKLNSDADDSLPLNIFVMSLLTPPPDFLRNFNLTPATYWQSVNKAKQNLGAWHVKGDEIENYNETELHEKRNTLGKSHHFSHCLAFPFPLLAHPSLEESTFNLSVKLLVSERIPIVLKMNNNYNVSPNLSNNHFPIHEDIFKTFFFQPQRLTSNNIHNSSNVIFNSIDKKIPGQSSLTGKSEILAVLEINFLDGSLSFTEHSSNPISLSLLINNRTKENNFDTIVKYEPKTIKFNRNQLKKLTEENLGDFELLVSTFSMVMPNLNSSFLSQTSNSAQRTTQRKIHFSFPLQLLETGDPHLIARSRRALAFIKEGIEEMA